MAFAPAAALVAGGVGAGLTAFGQVEQGQAQANMANYQSAVAANNAVIANQNAAYASAAGEQQAQLTALKGASTVGGVKAAQAARGIDVNSGSAVGVQTGAREAEKLDTEQVLQNAELTAYGFRTQATTDTAQSQLYQLEAKQAPMGADIGAAGGLLGNASSLGLKWGTGGLGTGADAVNPEILAA